MFSTIITLLVISLTRAAPLTRDLVDNTQSFGANPISVSSVKLVGIQTSENSCSHRDLGFTGEINGQWYAIYGDCLWCAPGVTDPRDDTEDFNGMVRDSVSLMTSNVLKPRDLNLNDDTPVPHQNQFVPYNESWGETQMYGFGGTSLCATDDYNEEGLLFYLVNANEAGIQGAGVAKVKVINGTPTVIKRFSINNTGYWWPSSTNPCYGDVAAYRDPNSDYIYALGNPPSNLSGYAERQYVYQARVQYQDAFDLSKYEYWHGRDAGWQPTPLDISECNTETAVMWGVGQGQLTWNAHYNCYIFVHTQPATNKVVLRTAAKPEGPWSADVTVYEATLDNPGYIYAGVAHPYLDRSGKTLTISYTKLENVIEVIEVAFN